MDQTWIMASPGGVRLRIRVKPRSSREGIEGIAPDGCLVVRLNAPPVDNKANAALIALLAKTLRLPKSAVSIESGERGRLKVIFLEGADEEVVRKSLAGE